MESELTVEVFEDQDGKHRVNVAVDSRELLTRLKQSIEAQMPLFRFEKPKTFSKQIHLYRHRSKERITLILLKKVVVVLK